MLGNLQHLVPHTNLIFYIQLSSLLLVSLCLASQVQKQLHMGLFIPMNNT